MAPDVAAVAESPWGLALIAIVVLLPRLILRVRDPAGLQGFSRMRLVAGYVVAVVLAMGLVPLSDPLQVRAWIEAVPVRSAIELMAVSSSAKYLLAALVAWFMVAYLVAPLAALLASYNLANGLLLVFSSVPVAGALGIALWLAWPQPGRSAVFSIASALVLVVTLGLGFSIGARLPLHARRVPSAT